MKKETLLTISIIFLLILNLGTLAYLFFDKPAPPPPRPDRLIIEELNFDEEQIEKFEILKKEAHRAFMEFDSKINDVASVYFALIKKDSFETAAKDSLENVMTAIQKEKADYLFSHFQDIKNICRDEQIEKFNKILPRLTHLINPPHRRPKPPHHNGK